MFGVLALDFFVQVWIFMLHALIALMEKCAYLWICTTNTNKQRLTTKDKQEIKLAAQKILFTATETYKWDDEMMR